MESQRLVGSKAKASRLQAARSPSLGDWLRTEASSRYPALPKGFPTSEVAAAARLASALKEVTVSSNGCPVKERGRKASAPSPYIKQATTATFPLSLIGFLDQIKNYFLKAKRRMGERNRFGPRRCGSARATGEELICRVFLSRRALVWTGERGLKVCRGDGKGRQEALQRLRRIPQL